MNKNVGFISSHFPKLILIIASYALAMAYLESATVVYLQRALSITPRTLFPMRDYTSLGGLGSIEIGREIATLVMLASVGWLVGHGATERLAWSAIAFGIWDLGYYFFLWIFIGWPTSFGTYDLLFLLPVPWVGPVWAPMIVSVALIFFGLLVVRRSKSSNSIRIRLRDGALMCAGGLVVIISFTLHFKSIIDGAIPTTFAWPIFLIGMGLGVLGFGEAIAHS